MMETRYDQMQESQEQLRLLRHDMLHHIRLAAGLLNEGRAAEAADYLGRIDGLVAAVDMRQYCLSRTGNITLTWYAREAARLGVRFECRADIPPERPECSADLCAVLANALQNALEGCQTAVEPYIKVVAALAGHALLLSVENSFDGVLQYQDGDIISRKPQEGHGLGLAGIRKKAESHGGYFQYSAEGTTFRLEVALGNIFA